MAGPDAKTDPAKALRWPLGLTYAGLWAERVTRAFWPVWSVAFVAMAMLWSGVLLRAPLEAAWALLALLGLAGARALWRGVGMFHLPRWHEAQARLDASLPGRPLSTLQDTQAVGGDDPASARVWAAHRARMAARLIGARAVEPDLRVAAADPFALRYLAVLALALVVLFGGAFRAAELGDLAAGGVGAGGVAGPAWEAWIEPPRYTGKPTLYLNDIDSGAVPVPQGSKVIVRLYGQVGALAVSETVSGRDKVDPTLPAQEFTVAQAGTFAIEGAGGDPVWSFSATPDAVPVIAADGPAGLEAPTQFRLGFAARDDYQVTAGTARIALDLDAVPRRYGLAVDPEPREALVIDLPLPISGSRSEFSEVLLADVSKHPWVGLPVQVTLTASDAAGQVGESDVIATELFGRSFFDPLANAVIEQRRDILWARANASRAAMVLRTLTHRADDIFDSPSAYLMVRMAIRRLEAGPLTREARDEVAEVLWQAALRIEEGNLQTALDQLRRAQERLSEAIRQGATEEEVDQLMSELREAMDNYMRQLAQQQQQNGGQQDQQQAQGERQEVTQDQLDQLLERIEELMREGRVAEAQELLRQLQQMMENMEVTQGQPGEGDGQPSPGEQAMQDLQETLRDQQGLSDEAFRDLQEQFNPNAQAGESDGNVGRNGGRGQGESHEGQGGEGQQGDQQGEGSTPDAGSLAGRQQALRDQLGQLQRNLPAPGSEAGQAARDALDQAGRAMDDAARALEEGDLPGAIDDQAQAMEALREGMRNLGRALAEEQQDGQGQQGTEFGQDGTARQQDPLGREAGNSGQLGTDDNLLSGPDAYRRARELLDEIRRRSSEQERPDIELEYLKRLLDRF